MQNIDYVDLTISFATCTIIQTMDIVGYKCRLACMNTYSIHNTSPLTVPNSSKWVDQLSEAPFSAVRAVTYFKRLLICL